MAIDIDELAPWLAAGSHQPGAASTPSSLPIKDSASKLVAAAKSFKRML